MNEDVKALWVTALLSDEYKQGRKRLTGIKDGVETNCCLGVLCKVAIAQGLDIGVRTMVYGDEQFIDYDSEGSVTPKSVMDWAGMTEGNPVVDDEKYGRNSLAEFNDDGKTFVEIAEIIERNL